LVEVKVNVLYLVIPKYFCFDLRMLQVLLCYGFC
jgi:hypothetical protein